MSTFIKILLALFVIGVIIWIAQFLWSILPIIGIIMLAITVYFAYNAYKEKKLEDSDNVINLEEFKKKRNLAIVAGVISVLCFVIPKGPSMQEREEAKQLEKEARQEELEANRRKREEERKIEEEIAETYGKFHVGSVDRLDSDFTIYFKKNNNNQDVAVDLVGLRPEFMNEEFEDEAEARIKELIADNDIYVEEVDSWPGEITLYYGYVWLEDPTKSSIEDENEKREKLMLNAILAREGYFEVYEDGRIDEDTYNYLVSLQDEAFEEGVIKWWNPARKVGRDPNSGEIIKDSWLDEE